MKVCDRFFTGSLMALSTALLSTASLAAINMSEVSWRLDPSIVEEELIYSVDEEEQGGLNLITEDLTNSVEIESGVQLKLDTEEREKIVLEDDEIPERIRTLDNNS